MQMHGLTRLENIAFDIWCCCYCYSSVIYI